MTDNKQAPKRNPPHDVDVHVGMRIRQRRKYLRVSQITLATKLGLTFQQIQKYERGSNRISASKLFEAAQALAVPVGYFYEGLVCSSADAESAENQVAATFLGTDEGIALAEVFPRIRNAEIRATFLQLATVLADGTP